MILCILTTKKESNHLLSLKFYKEKKSKNEDELIIKNVYYLIYYCAFKIIIIKITVETS